MRVGTDPLERLAGSSRLCPALSEAMNGGGQPYVEKKGKKREKEDARNEEELLLRVLSESWKDVVLILLPLRIRVPPLLPRRKSLRQSSRIRAVLTTRQARVDRVLLPVRTGDGVVVVLLAEAGLAFFEGEGRLVRPPVLESAVFPILTTGLVCEGVKKRSSATSFPRKERGRT